MGLRARRLIERIRWTMFPSEQQRVLKKWYADGGDDALRYDYDLNEKSLVLDIGGYKGQFASDIYARFNCRVLIFEPVKAFAEEMGARFKHNDRIEVIQKALGASRRTERMSVCDDGSSTWKTGARKEDIDFEDVALLFSERRITRVDLMKINIEGGEYELLPRLCETGLIRLVGNLQVQFHELTADSDARMNDIQKELSKTHTPAYQYRYVWESWRQKD